MMDLISLRYFVETVRQRSISKAAISLGVVQPALSRRIRLLEESLGTPLLMRHKRGVEPTQAGLLVIERAEPILHMTHQLTAEIRSLSTEPIGIVALGFPPSIGNLFVGRLLAACNVRYPRVELHLQESFPTVVRDALIANQLDLGIMNCEAHHPDLVVHPLFEETIWLIGRPQAWPYQQRPLDPNVLDNLPLVVSSYMHKLLERQQTRFNYRLRVVADADSLAAGREALHAGLGFLVVPPSAVDRELTGAEFVGVPLKGLFATRGLFRHRHRPLTSAGRALTEMITLEVRQLCTSRSDILRALPSVEPA
jgi:LysR family transcriptional regulator, nitrogen assimilation regulatory protein